MCLDGTNFGISSGTCCLGAGGVVAFSTIYRAALRRVEGEALGSVRMLLMARESEIEHLLGLFTEEEGAVIVGVGEGFAKEGIVATPVGDGVAMNAGLSRGVGRIQALGQGGDDDELFGGKWDVGHGFRFTI